MLITVSCSIKVTVRLCRHVFGSLIQFCDIQRFICQRLHEVTSERVFFSGHESCRWNSENMTKGFFPPKVFLLQTWDNDACLLFRKSIHLPISVHKLCYRYVSSNSSSRHVGPLWTTVSRSLDRRTSPSTSICHACLTIGKLSLWK